MHGIKKKNVSHLIFVILFLYFLVILSQKDYPEHVLPGRLFPCSFDTTEYFFLCHSYLIIAVVVFVFF